MKQDRQPLAVPAQPAAERRRIGDTLPAEEPPDPPARGLCHVIHAVPAVEQQHHPQLYHQAQPVLPAQPRGLAVDPLPHPETVPQPTQEQQARSIRLDPPPSGAAEARPRCLAHEVAKRYCAHAPSGYLPVEGNFLSGLPPI